MCISIAPIYGTYPIIKSPCRRWGFDTHSVTVQYTETVAVLKVSSEVIKCPTIGAASFGQSPYVARLLPVRGVVGHNIDRRIRGWFVRLVWVLDYSVSDRD